jgi:alkaline phosphatase
MKQHAPINPDLPSRRAFLRDGSLLLRAATADNSHSAPAALEPVVRVGLVTDVHYADADTRGTRHYRESLGKMREAVDRLNRGRIDLAVELGDLIDAPKEASAEKEAAFLRSIAGEWGRLQAKRHQVLGNHCVNALTKERFLSAVEQPRPFYSFDQNGVHFVLLDACFRQDGTAYDAGNFAWTDTDIPPHEREWLRADLDATNNKAVVFVHQRLDLPVGHAYAVHSSPAVRKILEDSGKVLAVFQGHSHKNEHATLGGSHYCVLAAMVEGSGAANNGYCVLNVYPDGTLKLEGYRKHAEHPLARNPNAAVPS